MLRKVVPFSSFICRSSKMSPLTVSPIAIINSMSHYIVYSFVQVVYSYILLSSIKRVQKCLYVI